MFYRGYLIFSLVILYYLSMPYIAHSASDTIDFERVYIASKWKSGYGDQVIIKSDSIYKLMTGGGTLPDSLIDFEKYALLGMIIKGDCDARFEYDVVNEPEDRNYTVKIFNNYGGCLKERKWYFWLKVSKLPEGYRYKFEEELLEKYYTAEEQQINRLMPRFQRAGWAFDSTKMDTAALKLFDIKKKLVGTWLLDRWNGKRMVTHGTGAQTTTWTFTGDEIKVQMGNVIQKGVYTINHVEAPYKLTWQMSNQLGFSRSIFEFTDDTLTIKVNSKGSKGYAAEFDVEQNYLLYELRKRSF